MNSRRLLAACAVLAAACASAAVAARPVVGSPAPAFSLNTLDHRAVTLAEVTANGPGVIVVLRGWPGYQCPVCTKQFAAFRAKADAFRAAGVPVLFVYPGPSDGLAAHADEFFGSGTMPAGFTFVIDPDYAFTNAWGLRWDKPKETAYPSTFVVDSAGAVRFAKVSASHGDRVAPEAALAAAVGAKAATTRPAE